MANTKTLIPDEQRPFHGRSLPPGDTGDGDTGVPSDEQGISSRPGDRPTGMSAQADDGPDEDDEDEGEVGIDNEDLDEESDDDDEDDEEDEDEQTDPGSEPGKPV